MSISEGGDKPRRKPRKKQPKRKLGRPSNYCREALEDAKRMAELGFTDVEMASFLKVNISNFYEWQIRDPAFREAIKTGKEVADARVVRRLYERACGFTTTEVKDVRIEGKPGRLITITKQHPPETAAMIFWLKNRQPELWREKIDVEHKHLFNFVGMLPSREEWLAKYASNPEPLTIEVRPQIEEDPDGGAASD